MKKIGPDETVITGDWYMSNGHMRGDENCLRIEEMTQHYLVKLGHDWSGWETLYRDPSDGRYWELTYPQGHMHGGGPPELRLLSPNEARQKYGDVVVTP